MKQTLPFIAALLFSLTSLAQNLVINGSFHDWDLATKPSAWSKAESATQETIMVHSGSYSLKHTGAAETGTKALGQYVSVSEDETYNISIWYLTVQGDGKDSRIWAKWKDSEKKDIKDDATKKQLEGPNNNYLSVQQEWAEYATTVKAPLGATYLYLEVRTYIGAITYWDDFSVTLAEGTYIKAPKIESFAVYPNPFFAELNINGSELYSVEVINSVGQLISQIMVGNMDKVQISTDDLAKGIYMLRIMDLGGHVEIKKVIKK